MGNAPDKSLTLNGNVPSTNQDMADEFLKSVQEIQISQRFMLKRLNELYHTSDGQCSCGKIQDQYRKEISQLETKVNELERAIDEKDTFQKVKEKEYKELKERVELLETFLMTLQTDDSKIRSVSLKRDKAAFENEDTSLVKVTKNSKAPDAEKPMNKRSEDVSQVYHARDVEYSKHFTDISYSEIVKAVNVKKSKSLTDEGQKQSIPTEEPSRFQTPPAQGADGLQKDVTPTVKSNFKMVEQSERKSYGDEHFWRYLAQREIDDGRKTLKDLQGVHTVIVLDISASMAEESAWEHALKFVRDYLNGLEEISTRHGLSNEYVALVTFGHETKVQQRLTNNYSLLKQLVENQSLGGPSPLYGGLVLALAAAGSSSHQVEIINTVTIFSKVIIVTDGQLTEVGQYEGPDKAMEDLSETKAKLIQCMDEFKDDRIDTYYVQVGKENEETQQLSELMMSIVDGKTLDFKSGRQFSKRHYLTTKIADPFGILTAPFKLFEDLGEDFSEEDKRMIEDIKQDAQKNLFSIIDKRSQNKYREIKNSKLPAIGCRVRRGPDWKWGQQDSNGPGTVTGHDNGDQVWVEWDEDGHHNVYRYGQPGYDVLIVDEPRKLKFGQTIAVGCVVRPGKDWTKSAGNAQNWQRGVVIKVEESKASVRWDNGESGDYTYSGTGKCEIEVCTGFRAFRSEGHVLGSDWTEAQQGQTTKTKNKNKNV